MFCSHCGKEIPDGSVYCAYCGAKNQIVQPETAKVGLGEEDFARSADMSSLERQIIGKNVTYYETQFQEIRRSGKGKINWASLFLGIFHSGYRNVWKEWLKALWLPLTVESGALLLAGIVSFFQPGASLIMILISVAASIWLLVAEILYARKFNRIYLRHVEQKINQNDESSDLSSGRGILVGAAMTVLTGIVGGASSYLMTMGTMRSIVSDLEWAEDELSEDNPGNKIEEESERLEKDGTNDMSGDSSTHITVMGVSNALYEGSDNEYAFQIIGTEKAEILFYQVNNPGNLLYYGHVTDSGESSDGNNLWLHFSREKEGKIAISFSYNAASEVNEASVMDLRYDDDLDVSGNYTYKSSVTEESFRGLIEQYTDSSSGAGESNISEMTYSVDGIYQYDNGIDAICTANVNFSQGEFSVECTGYGGHGLYAFSAEECLKNDTGYYVSSEFGSYDLTFADGGMYVAVAGEPVNSMASWLEGYYYLVESYESSANQEIGSFMYVVNCSESITLRNAPSTSAEEITQIPLYGAVDFLGIAGNGFYQVSYNGQTGYALADYLDIYEPEVYTGVTCVVVNCNESITLRTSPSTSAGEICQIPLGAVVDYIESAANGFYLVSYCGQKGYALASYLQMR